MQSLNRFLKFLFIACSLFFLGHSLFIIADGLKDSDKNADVAVILGSKVNEDGTLSKRLEERLHCGLQLYQNKRVKKIMVSGGLGKEGFYEGDKMKAYLISNGVADTAIIVDNLGNNTLATVKNTLRLKDSLGFKRILVVSQYFHISRTKMLFKKLGFKVTGGVSPAYFEWRDLYALLREFGAYYAEMYD